MDLHLSDKTFIVTAASSGLGLASARALIAEGANVVLVARRGDELDRLVAELGSQAHALALDLAAVDTAERAVTAAVETFGDVHGALISVGGPPTGGALTNTDAQWLAAFESVFLAAVRLTRAICEVRPDPRLAYVLSTTAKQPTANLAISNGLRPGLAVWIKQLADEIGPQGGRAVGLLPGAVATERLEYLFSQSPDPEGARAERAEQIPLRRLGRPEEFGSVAAFVLSDAASYLTGCMIPVDGGALRAL